MSRSPLVLAVIPVVFVLIWSTGWVVAKFAVPNSDPLTFLVMRYAIAGVLLIGFATLSGARIPSDGRAIGHALVSGVLLHGIYLGGVWWAIGHGLSAGLSALIAAIQPLLTALLAPVMVGERLSLRRWIGVGLGFAGLMLALEPKLAGIDLARLGDVALPIAVNVAAMVSVTFGTFYQKRFLAGGDLRVIVALQYLGALIVTAPAMLLLEPMRVVFNLDFALALGWSVFGLSIGAIALLLILIRRGEVSRAATLIYLVPPTAAVEAWLLLGETMAPIQIVGMTVTVIGVALANR